MIHEFYLLSLSDSPVQYQINPSFGRQQRGKIDNRSVEVFMYSPARIYDSKSLELVTVSQIQVNMIGVHYEESHVATGFGNHLARPIFHDEWHEDMTFEEGVKLLEKCMLVLLYRDRSAVNKLQLESALRASETAQYALRKERENTWAAIYTNEEFSSLQCQVTETNLLRESNAQLRDENKRNFEEFQELRDRLQNVQLEIEQLRKSVREDIELDVAQKELEMQKKETGHWENRVSKLLEKHKSIDVEHYEHIKFELQLLQC